LSFIVERMVTGSPRFRRCPGASARARRNPMPSPISAKPSRGGSKAPGRTGSQSRMNRSTPRSFAFEQVAGHLRARTRPSFGALRLRSGSPKGKPHDSRAGRPHDDIDRSRPSRTGSRNVAGDPSPSRHHTTTACRNSLGRSLSRKAVANQPHRHATLSAGEALPIQTATVRTWANQPGADDGDVLDVPPFGHVTLYAKAHGQSTGQARLPRRGRRFTIHS